MSNLPSRRANSRKTVALSLVTLFTVFGLTLSAYAEPQTRTSAFVYDGTSGLLIKEIIEPGSSDFCLVTAYEYDDYGNKKKAITRNCNGVAGTQPGVNNEAIGPTGDARIQVPDASGTLITVSIESTTEYAADLNGGWSLGQFPTTSTNALGQFETKQYDVRFGAVTKLTGPNLLATEWVYDGFGRKVLEKRADGTGTKWTYEYCVGVNYGTTDCPTIGGAAGAYVVVETPIVVSTNAKNGPISKTYYDGLNREIRKETEGSDVAGSSTAIYQDTRYNSQGRPYQKSRPYYSGQIAYWTELTYDSLGRVVTEERPDENIPAGAETHTAYSAVDGKPTVTVTNSLGQSRTTTKNSQGQVVQVKDAANQTLSFDYDGFGNLTQTTDALGNATTLNYDLRGRKIGMRDPDMGTWTYDYNALGQLIRQTNAKAQVSSMSYDLLGRMTEREEELLVSTWHYDHYKDDTACPQGIGKLCEVETSTGYNRRHSYDSLGRPVTTTVTVYDTPYTSSVAYDGITGRPTTQTYPTGFAVKYGYTNLGYLKDLRNNSTNDLYWEAISQDAEGHLLNQRFGNGVETLQNYNALNGRLTGILAGAGNAVQDFTYEYDSLGNMTKRIDGNQQNLKETFTYDNRNRMETSKISINEVDMATKTYTYDVLGNITSRSDVSLSAANNGYVYPASGAASVGPHAVSRVNLLGGGRRVYEYDANGNLWRSRQYSDMGEIPDEQYRVPGGGRVTEFTSFNMPSVIFDDGTSEVRLELSKYGPEHQRVTGSLTTATGTRETVYLNPDNSGGLSFEKEKGFDGTIEERHFLTAGGQVVAVVKRTNSTTWSTRYFHRDNLGSTTAVTDDSSPPNVVERLAYEPFGKRRLTDGSDDPTNSIVPLTTVRGFTNHEHLDELGLIHMNGRIYDPIVGRFMSADSVLPDTHNLQSYNRYSYVRNNPLAYTDPDGHCELFCWAVITIFAAEVAHQLDIIDTSETRMIQGIATAFALGPHGGLLTFGGPGQAVVAGFAGGFVGSNFSIEGGIVGGLTAGAFNLVGTHLSGPFENILGHAAVGCASSTLSGGDCGSGALAGGIGSAALRFMPDGFKNNPVLQGAYVAVVGGTAAMIGGGKFANGAQTAAFGYLFNYCAHNGCFNRRFNWNDAVDQWRNGNGSTVTGVEASELNLTDATYAKNPDGSYLIHTSLKFDTGAIYGTVTGVLNPNGTMSIRPDTYNFDFKNPLNASTGQEFGRLIVRDALTAVGLGINGFGTPYRIEFTGSIPALNGLPK